MTPGTPSRAARPISYWLDDPRRPDPCEALVEATSCDLAVVGGGFTGLWTALQAKERRPELDVVLVEAHDIGWAASGRNGGFCLAGLTHGLTNGIARFPDEIEQLERLGNENFAGLEETLRRYSIDCDFEPTGTLNVALAPYQVHGLREDAAQSRRFGQDVVLMDREQVQAEVYSPTYLGGLWTSKPVGRCSIRPVWLCGPEGGMPLTRVGVRIHEADPGLHTLERDGTGIKLAAPYGRSLRAQGGSPWPPTLFSPLLRRMRLLPSSRSTIYVLVTEPLTAAQWSAIGWRNRQGLGDGGNQFHYYRLTRDNRILWGGYDAIYHYNNGLRDELDGRPASFIKLARHFFTTFPQLEGIRFSHAWGGAIDTCSRFCVFWGTAMVGSRVAYASCYTGLGIVSTRFVGAVILALLSGLETVLTRLRFLKS